MSTDTKSIPAVPFEIASQFSTRASFTIPTTTLQAAAPTPITPIQVPAVGYLQGLMLQVDIAGSGGTNPAWQPDGPFNVIQSLNFRNAAGVNLIVPMTGYQYYLINKYGGQVPGLGPWCDPRYGIQAVATDTYAATASFYLWVPLGIDASEALATVPALASNANYQLEMTLAAQGTVTTSNPTLVVDIRATAVYFDLPSATDVNGAPQSQAPNALSTASLWLLEQPSVNPGDGFVQSNNVGNIIRTHILVVRNSSGARIDTNGIPALTEMYLDNNPRFAFTRDDWEWWMSRWFGLGAATKNTVGGLDTGVYAIPYHALLGSASGDPANTRAQLMPTLNSTLLQFRGMSWGSAISKLEIMTNVVTTENVPNLYSK